MERVSQRSRRRGLLGGALAVGLAVGGAGVAAALSGDGTPVPTSTSTPTAGATSGAATPTPTTTEGAPGDRVRPEPGHRPGPRRWHGPAGRHGPRAGAFGRVLHGELVVPQRSGSGTRTLVVQRGTVTSASASALTVKSSDGFTASYTIGSTTRVRAGSAGIASIAQGATVRVVAAKSGSTLSAVRVAEREGRPDVGPRGKRPGGHEWSARGHERRTQPR